MTKRELWMQELPIWVSRKDANGMISKFSVPLWLFMLIGLIVLLNFLLWGGIGIYEAIRMMIP